MWSSSSPNEAMALVDVWPCVAVWLLLASPTIFSCARQTKHQLRNVGQQMRSGCDRFWRVRQRAKGRWQMADGGLGEEEDVADAGLGVRVPVASTKFVMADLSFQASLTC
jgi:hypothetical protein